MRWCLAIVIMWSLAVSASTAAQEPEFPSTSGDSFVQFCSAIDKNDKTVSESLYLMACIGYVDGLIDGGRLVFLNAANKNITRLAKPYCLPDDVGNHQLVVVILKYIQTHPDTAKERTALLALKALGEVFPCSNK